jgi:serine/threonine protein phosphatase PrpC
MTREGEQVWRVGPENSSSTPLTLRVAARSDAGPVRELNEDYVSYRLPEDPALRGSQGAIFLVADGMGGHRAGEVASREAVEWVMDRYYAYAGPDAGDGLVRAFQSANQALHGLAQADATRLGMGTTLVAAVVRETSPRLTIANVGDSRAYLLRGNKLVQITTDHSWVEEQIQAGLFKPEQAERHPNRNVITRALGSKPTVEVDLFEGEIGAGDAILLCTDGLSGELSDAQMSRILRSSSPPRAAAQLVAEARRRGGNDNVSALVVRAEARKGALAGWSFERVRERLQDLEPGQRWPLAAVVALALFVVCLCGMAISFPIVDQELVGNPAAAPRIATIYDERPPEGAHWGATEGGLDPPLPGVFLVGVARDWQVEDASCSFSLIMVDSVYEISCNPASFVETEGQPNLDGRHVRVFGYQAGDGNEVEAQLIDLGARWWEWQRPAWAMIYADHDWRETSWVYTIADENPYSPVQMADYPGLDRGEWIVALGTWLPGDSEHSMGFSVARLYRLENGRYVPFEAQTP